MLSDFVLETTSAPGTSTTITLAGAATGPFCRFRDKFSSGNPVYFTITDNSTQSQAFRGTLTTGTPDTLTVVETFKSNAGTTTRLNFTGTCYVSSWVPSDKALYIDGSGKAPIPGTKTNDDASVGQVGEIISHSATANASSGSATDIATISLTAGDWDIHGALSFTNAGATFTQILGWISTTSASVPSFPNGGALIELQASFTAAANQVMSVGSRRLSLSATTTVYLSTLHSFTGSGPTSVGGFIEARRRR